MVDEHGNLSTIKRKRIVFGKLKCVHPPDMRLLQSIWTCSGAGRVQCCSTGYAHTDCYYCCVVFYPYLPTPAALDTKEGLAENAREYLMLPESCSVVHVDVCAQRGNEREESCIMTSQFTNCCAAQGGGRLPVPADAALDGVRLHRALALRGDAAAHLAGEGQGQGEGAPRAHGPLAARLPGRLL